MTHEPIEHLTENTDEHSRIQFDDLDEDMLASISRSHGVDYATRLLYDRARKVPANQQLSKELEALGAGGKLDAPFAAKVLIVPAMFYKEYPRYGGDGRVIKSAADTLGIPCQMIPLHSTGGIMSNAEVLGRAINSEPEENIILVSLSKGGADARVAFERGFIHPGKVKIWIQIAGIVHGTPLANHLAGNWWWRMLLKGYLRYRHAGHDLINELCRGPKHLLRGRARAPEGVTVINIVGFPLRQHLSGSLVGRHKQLAKFGPNDGCILLRDSFVEPGFVLPIWGENHYFQNPDLSELMVKVLRHAAVNLLKREPMKLREAI